MFLRYTRTWNDDIAPRLAATSDAHPYATNDPPTRPALNHATTLELVALISLGLALALLTIALLLVSGAQITDIPARHDARQIRPQAIVSPLPASSLASDRGRALPIVEKHVGGGASACGGRTQPPRAQHPRHPWSAVGDRHVTPLQPTCSMLRQDRSAGRL